MTAPAIPAWEMTALDALANAGDLSGLNPIILGAIDQAESSGSGGGINSSGYGGFFGLGANKKYPGGTTTTALLQGTDPGSFEAQAEIAASAFAGYLTQEGGDPVKAEEVYQSGAANGPTEGSKIVAADLGLAPAAGGAVSSTNPAAATLTSFNANPLDLFGIPSTAASTVGSDISKVASALWSDVAKYVLTLAFVGAGLTLVVVGIKGLGEDNGDKGSGGGAAGGGGVLASLPSTQAGDAATGLAEDVAPIAAVA